MKFSPSHHLTTIQHMAHSKNCEKFAFISVRTTTLMSCGSRCDQWHLHCSWLHVYIRLFVVEDGQKKKRWEKSEEGNCTGKFKMTIETTDRSEWDAEKNWDEKIEKNSKAVFVSCVSLIMRGSRKCWADVLEKWENHQHFPHDFSVFFLQQINRVNVMKTHR